MSTYLNFARHLQYLENRIYSTYDLSDDAAKAIIPKLLESIRNYIKNGSLSCEQCFFHAYISGMNESGRELGFNTIDEYQEIESLHDLLPDEKREVLDYMRKSLILYQDALIFDIELREKWSTKWEVYLKKIKKAYFLFAYKNEILFE